MIVAHSLETSIFGMGPQLNEGPYVYLRKVESNVNNIVD